MQHNPQIYLIFWGPNWGGITDPNIQAVNTFFQQLAGGDYNNILSQYSDSSSDPTAYVHNTAQLDGIWLDSSIPTSPITNNPIINRDDIGNEVGNGLVANPSWVAGPNTQVFVFPQKGSQYSSSWGHFDIPNGECAEHDNSTVSADGVSFNIADSTMLYPYQLGQHSCAFDSDANVLTIFASHEYAETATDPYALGGSWAAGGGINCFNEVADLCDPKDTGPVTTTYTPRDANGNELVIEVQELWSNEANTCVGYRGEEQVSSAYGKHTVYGQLQTAYDALGGISSYRAIRAAKPIR